MQRQLGGWFVAIVVVAAIAPVLAAGRAVADEWVPIGDNAAIALLADDVFSTDTPSLGMPTTLGSSDAHHPGPLQFWSLALPATLAGGDAWGIVVGVAIVAVAGGARSWG